MRYIEPSSLIPGIEMYLAKDSLSKDSSMGIALILCSTLDSFSFSSNCKHKRDRDKIKNIDPKAKTLPWWVLILASIIVFPPSCMNSVSLVSYL